MEIKIFCVHDLKAHAFMPPFCLPTIGMAIRTFRDCCNDSKHAFGAHPEDYSLHECGFFDDNKGVITAFAEPLLVISGIQCLKPEVGTDENA